MRKIAWILAVAASLVNAVPIEAQTGPKFGKNGGVGSSSSTFSGGEPTGGTYSIDGTTGAATFNTVTETGSRTANTVRAAPNGSNGVPTYRSLVTADIPTGTAGATIPLLSGNNSWGGTQVFSVVPSIPFTPSGSGSVPTTVDAFLKTQTISVFNCMTASQIADVQSGTLAIDVTVPIQTCIGQAQSLATTGSQRGAVVYFPPGQYKLTATLTVTTSRVALRGAGKFRSVLRRNTNYGPTIKIESQTAGTLNLIEMAEVSGLSFFHDVSGAVAMTDEHIRATGITHGLFENLDINNGAYGISFFGGVDVSVLNTNIIGQNTTGANNGIAGIRMLDAAASGFALGSLVSLPTQYHIERTQVFGPLNSGFLYGLLINAAENISVLDSYFGNAKTNNVYIQQTARNMPILEVAFGSGVYIDGSGADSVRLDGITGNGSAYIGTVSFNNVDIKGQSGQTPGSGIFVDGTVRAGTYAQAVRNLRIVGCRIGDYNNNGVWLVGGQNIVMSGNMIGGNNYNNSAGGRGVLVGSAVNRFSITGGTIGGLPEGNGTSFQTAGIEIVSGALNGLVSNVDVRNNVTGIVDGTAGATTAARSVWVTNNPGYNGNRTAAAPAIPASGTNQYNPYGALAWVSVFGGTVSDIKLNGQTVSGASGWQGIVGPGDRLTLTYTVAPSWVWWPM